MLADLGDEDLGAVASDVDGRCFACHGPDEESREAKLRLDNVKGATRDLDGYSAIVPGNPKESEMLFRISLPADDDEIMPPQKQATRLPWEMRKGFDVVSA